MPGLEATLTANGRELRVVCLHLFPPVARRQRDAGFLESIQANAALRREQATYLAARYANERRPLLVFGDMNEGSEGEAMKVLKTAGLHRACDIATARCGATFPGATSRLPAVFEIDHILGRGISFSEAKVIREGASDHFPTYARLTLQP